jgi:hypothetical protein
MSVVSFSATGGTIFVFSRKDPVDYRDRFQLYADNTSFTANWNDDYGTAKALATRPLSIGVGPLFVAHRWTGTQCASQCGTNTTALITSTYTANRDAPVIFGNFAGLYFFKGSIKVFVLWSVALSDAEQQAASNIINARYPGGLR